MQSMNQKLVVGSASWQTGLEQSADMSGLFTIQAGRNRIVTLPTGNGHPVCHCVRMQAFGDKECSPQTTFKPTFPGYSICKS